MVEDTPFMVDQQETTDPERWAVVYVEHGPSGRTVKNIIATGARFTEEEAGRLCSMLNNFANWRMARRGIL